MRLHTTDRSGPALAERASRRVRCCWPAESLIEGPKPKALLIFAATLAGLIRWCPICDAYEAMDKEIGMIATPKDAVAHALFLRTYTSRLTLMVEPGDEQLTADDRRRLNEAGIRLRESPITQLQRVGKQHVCATFSSGVELQFDFVYPMLGVDAQSALAISLGAKCDEQGELIVDKQQATTVPGLYAAGDIVRALNQMSVGMAHAALAATAIHNSQGENPRQASQSVH